MIRLTILLTLFVFTVSAQPNLVLNPGFENFNQCPVNQNDYAAMQSWYSVLTTSADFYNACSNYPDAGVPQNFLGNQTAHQGNGYAGVVLYLNNPQMEYREYVGAKLTQPLVAGKKYCVTFYVAAADSAGLQTNTIAAYIGDSINSATPFGITALPYTPQIQTTQYIENNAGWQLVEGEYTAQGGEQYITIGSFTGDANTTFGPNGLEPNPFGPNQTYMMSYVYIDNVVLKECDKVGLDEETNVIDIELYPNPTSGLITLDLPVLQTNVDMELYNLAGALVAQYTIKPTPKAKIDVSALSIGLYIARISTNGTPLIHKKILITK